jgi:hypothetical protein
MSNELKTSQAPAIPGYDRPSVNRQVMTLKFLLSFPRLKPSLPGMAYPGSRPAAGGSTEHLCQLSLGKWISGLNAHLVSRYRFVIYVISGIFPPEGVVIAGLLARPPSFPGS